MPNKIRLDQLLADRGLAESREKAQALDRAGQVVVGEQRVDKPGTRVDETAPLRLKGEVCPYVSRGGLKLAGAFEQFCIGPLDGLKGLDIGASTGGFTDCLLQHGTAHVWAVDTGRGQIHPKFRDHPQVTLREQANARYLEPDWVDGQPIDLVAIDVSFISLKLILPPLAAILAPAGQIIALVKFEAGRERVGKGGVVRDRRVHRDVLRDLADYMARNSWTLEAIGYSPVRGPAGNVEFFFRLRRAGAAPGLSGRQLDIAIEQVLDDVYNRFQNVHPDQAPGPEAEAPGQGKEDIE